MRDRSSIPRSQRARKRRERIEVKNPNAVALGRLGGQKGGRARAAKLSGKERREIAVKAARARWGKKKRSR
jgi:hypothetical protein